MSKGLGVCLRPGLRSAFTASSSELFTSNSWWLCSFHAGPRTAVRLWNIVLSCPNLGFPEGAAAMPLTVSRPVGPHLSPRWQQLTFRPALRGHHRIRWEIFLVKVLRQSYAYTFQPGQADRGGREGLASTALDISDNPPSSSSHGDPPCPPMCGRPE